MENPATWKRAEKIILDALTEHDKMTAAGAVGFSSPRFVADRLRAAGLLNDADEPEIGWEGVRA